MKEHLKGCLTFILVVLLSYGLIDHFGQRKLDREFEQVIVAMQDSMDDLERFFQENEDDLEYLITKCIEDDIIFYWTSIYSTKPGDHGEITAEQEVLSRRDRLIGNIPNNLALYYISSRGIAFHQNNTVTGTTLFLAISSPPFTQGHDGGVIGSIGTIKAGRTWTVDVASYSHFAADYARAEKILKKLSDQASSEGTPAG